jgi:hypothetical protein
MLTPLAGLLLFLLPPRRRTCPFCAESIQAAATVCRYCHREVMPVALSTALPPRTKIILAVLITAVLLVALSQCHYRFHWWRGDDGIQVQWPPIMTLDSSLHRLRAFLCDPVTRHSSLVTGPWDA